MVWFALQSKHGISPKNVFPELIVVDRKQCNYSSLQYTFISQAILSIAYRCSITNIRSNYKIHFLQKFSHGIAHLSSNVYYYFILDEKPKVVLSISNSKIHLSGM